MLARTIGRPSPLSFARFLRGQQRCLTYRRHWRPSSIDPLKWLTTAEARTDLVPPMDLQWLAAPPAQVDHAALPQGREIDEASANVAHDDAQPLDAFE